MAEYPRHSKAKFRIVCIIQQNLFSKQKWEKIHICLDVLPGDDVGNTDMGRLVGKLSTV